MKIWLAVEYQESVGHPKLRLPGMITVDSVYWACAYFQYFFIDTYDGIFNFA